MSKLMFYIIIVLLSFNCTFFDKENNKSFDFDGQTFFLPGKVKEFQKKNNFEYSVYRGFRGQTKSYISVLLLEDNYLWTGSENVTEEFYKNHNVVGILFKEKKGVNLDDKKEQLEYIYNKTFEPLGKTSFEFVKLENDIVVVSSKKNMNSYLTFFVNQSNNSIRKYLENTW